MKEPRRDGRPPTDTDRHVPDVQLDPMLGAQAGFPEHPHPRKHVDAEPGARDDAVDPYQEPADPALATPALRPAVLGRLEGTGLIVVVRDAEGDVVDVDGTWRPGDERASREELRTTFPEGSTARFVGTRVEARGQTGEEVNVEVVIERHGTYETDDGRTLHIVAFSPREPG
ncbi:MAG: hypothetical protein P1P87_06295 [Trueperaceae bacterium]|nr:hypothetical protein [Trueperaceae bacterium]